MKKQGQKYTEKVPKRKGTWAYTESQ